MGDKHTNKNINTKILILKSMNSFKHRMREWYEWHVIERWHLEEFQECDSGWANHESYNKM